MSNHKFHDSKAVEIKTGDLVSLNSKIKVERDGIQISITKSSKFKIVGFEFNDYFYADYGNVRLAIKCKNLDLI